MGYFTDFLTMEILTPAGIRGMPNPALTDLLSSQDGYSIAEAMSYHIETGIKRRRTVLVPGCGRGYDVNLFASFGFDAYGIEISKSAVDMCREEQEGNAHKYPVQDHSVGAGKAEFLVGDFFSDAWNRDIGISAFDVIYDYTVRIICKSHQISASG